MSIYQNIVIKIINESNEQNLIDIQQLFIYYFNEKQIDGKRLMNMKRKTFAFGVCGYDNNNKDLHDICGILYDKII